MAGVTGEIAATSPIWSRRLAWRREKEGELQLWASGYSDICILHIEPACQPALSKPATNRPVVLLRTYPRLAPGQQSVNSPGPPCHLSPKQPSRWAGHHHLYTVSVARAAAVLSQHCTIHTIRSTVLYSVLHLRAFFCNCGTAVKGMGTATSPAGTLGSIVSCHWPYWERVDELGV